MARVLNHSGWTWPLKELIHLKNSIVLQLKTEHSFIPSREIRSKSVQSKANDRTIEENAPQRDSKESARNIEGYSKARSELCESEKIHYLPMHGSIDCTSVLPIFPG